MLGKNKKFAGDAGKENRFALGRQLTIEYYECGKTALLESHFVENAMLKAAKESGATIISSSFHDFNPQGISGVVVIAESHFTVHAWPEYDYAAVDIFTCGESINLETAVDSLKTSFESQNVVISSDQNRGLISPQPFIKEKVGEVLKNSEIYPTSWRHEVENHHKIIKGWFSEICDMWPGAALSLEIEDVLFSKKSKFQQIDLFQTKHHGKMLVLDDIIQLTESDEFAYHEMLAHVPLFAHPNPESVLVIGGGDGGVLREVGRHTLVKSIDFCEIDETIIEVSKTFLPGISCGFDDPRVNVHIANGADWVQSHPGQYDVIIVDSSDPIGPGKALFEKPFYEGLKKSLKKNGMIATQGESFFMHRQYVIDLMKIAKELFPIQAYSHFLVPTYPGGNIGICLGSLGPDPGNLSRRIPESFQKDLQYYTEEIHKASFVLPNFARKLLENL